MRKWLSDREIPLPGQRILRSMIAVWLCFGIYMLRGQRGIPFYSVIAALQCLQPYAKSMRSVARNRLVGTAVGAIWGLAILLLERNLLFDGAPGEWEHYILLGLFSGAVLYSTVLLKVRETAYFSTVVFLCIAVNHIGDENPYIFVFNRALDTLIGVLVAEGINRLHLPRLRQKNVLFVSSISETIVGAGKTLSPYSKIELNRLIDDGAQFTLSTTQTPATVREMLPDVNLRLPIIAMDGSALYDLKKREYLKTVTMEEDAARRMMAFLDASGLHYTTNTIEDHLLVVRCGDLGDGALLKLYQDKRRSAYRNFVIRHPEQLTGILYFMVLDQAEAVLELYNSLCQSPWQGEYRVVLDTTKHYADSACLKIYAPEASRENMLRELVAMVKPTKVVTFGGTPGHCDVLIKNADKDAMVKALKRRFEPVDIRGWRNSFRW